MQIGRSNHTYKPLIEQLTYQNGIVDKVSFRYLELEQRPTPQLMWDIVVSDVVSPQGVLLSGGLEELAFLRFVFKIYPHWWLVYHCRMPISISQILSSLSIFTPQISAFLDLDVSIPRFLFSDLHHADLNILA